VEEDVRMLGVKIWRKERLEREEWAFVIKEAKAKLKGPVELHEEEDHELTIFSTLAGKGLRTETWRNNMQTVSFHDYVTPQSLFTALQWETGVASAGFNGVKSVGRCSGIAPRIN
jgi:hypothetical protein